MQSPDIQRLKHIWDYCIETEKTIDRYCEDFAIFDSDADYQRSVSFCILQISELSGGLSQEYRQRTADQMQWLSTDESGLSHPGIKRRCTCLSGAPEIMR